MQMQIGKFSPERDTSGQMFFEIKKWGLGRKKSWGFDTQTGGTVTPVWARPKTYFTGGVYGWGSARSAIKAAGISANELGSNPIFHLSLEAKKELDCLEAPVKYCSMPE